MVSKPQRRVARDAQETKMEYRFRNLQGLGLAAAPGVKPAASGCPAAAAAAVAVLVVLGPGRSVGPLVVSAAAGM